MIYLLASYYSQKQNISYILFSSVKSCYLWKEICRLLNVIVYLLT